MPINKYMKPEIELFVQLCEKQLESIRTQMTAGWIDDMLRAFVVANQEGEDHDEYDLQKAENPNLKSEESVNEKQHEQEEPNVKLEKPLTLSAVHEDSPPRTTEIKPEIIKFKKISKFVEVSPNVRKNEDKNEIVRSSKPAKFVVLQHKQNEPDSKKEPSKKNSKKKDYEKKEFKEKEI